MKRLKILILFLTLTVMTAPMTSCNVKLVPEKSAAMYMDVQDVFSDATSLYDRIIVSNDKRFATYENDYDAVIGKAKAITEKDKTRNKSGTFVSQDLKIIEMLEKYKKIHSDEGMLKNTESKVFKEYIKSFIRPRLISELSL